MAEEPEAAGAAPQPAVTGAQLPPTACSMPPPPLADQAQARMQPPQQLGAADRWPQETPADKPAPACRVPGCVEPLVQLYNMRHRVCVSHYRADQFYMEQGGPLCRFCQQCAKPHTLDHFDEGRRSCRESLQRHNYRRRPLGAGQVTGLAKRRSAARDAAPEVSGGTNSTVAWQPAVGPSDAPAPSSLSGLDPSVAALLHLPLPQLLPAQLPAPAQRGGQPEGSSLKRARHGTAAELQSTAAAAAVAPAASQPQGSPSGRAPSSVAGVALQRSSSSGALQHPSVAAPQPLRPQPVLPAAQVPAAAGQGAQLAEVLASLLASTMPVQQAEAVVPPAARLAQTTAAAQPVAQVAQSAAAAAPVVQAAAAVPPAVLGPATAPPAAQTARAELQALAALPPAVPAVPARGQRVQPDRDQAALASLADSLADGVNRELLQTALALQQRVEELEQQLAAERAELAAERAQRAQHAARLISQAGAGGGVHLLRARVRVPGTDTGANVSSDDDLLAALADALPRPETTASLPTWLSTSNPVWQQAQQQRQQKQPQWQQQQQVQPAPPAKSRIGAHPQRAEQQQQQQQVSSQLQLAPQQPSRQQQQQQRPAQLQPAQQAQQRLAHQAQQVQQAQQQVPQQRPAEILAQLLRQFGPARPVPAQSIARAAHMQARQARQPQQQQAQRPQQPQQPQQQQAQLLRAANGTAASAAAVVQSGSPQGQPGEALPEHMQALARLLLRLSE